MEQKISSSKSLNMREQESVRRLIDKARAVVARWETPLWKDAPATATFIYELRDALSIAEKIAAEPVNVQMMDALRFYAEGHHFVLHDRDAWDTVSDEPRNCCRDSAGTATVENGSRARFALLAAEEVQNSGLPVKVEKQEPVNALLLEALHSTIDLLWLEDSHSVEFDGTVMFGPSYDFSVLDRRIEFLWPGFNCIVWPGSGWSGKWSAYCTYEGSLWFEKFETKEQAKEQCFRLLDQVMPNHPVSKARAALAAAQQAEPVRLTDDEIVDLFEVWNMNDGSSHADLIQAAEAAVLRKNGLKVGG